MAPSLFDRSDYPGLGEATYLNQASLGLIGQPAVAAMHTFIDNVARHGNLFMSDADEIEYCHKLRERAAKLFHADPSCVAIVASASEMLGQLPLLLRLKPGATVLAVSSDFPAITRPWLRWATFENLRMRFVDDVADRDLTDTIIDAIDENTGVVAVSSVQYITGTVVDVPRIAKRVAQTGAYLIVDATQAAGATRVDTTAIGADAVVTSGYKWLGGHGGVALAVVSESLLNQIPVLPGWMGAPNPFDFDARSVSFAPDARRFTQSTMAYISIAGLTTSIEGLLSLGDDQIEGHARRLAAVLVEGASEHGWTPFRAVHSIAACPHIISLGHRSESTVETVEKLRKEKVVCSARSDRVRVSLAPYNDGTDIEKLIEALAKLVSA
jgi:cysteine desulfurase/selenocysteine lyase